MIIMLICFLTNLFLYIIAVIFMILKFKNMTNDAIGLLSFIASSIITIILFNKYADILIKYFYK